MTSNITSLALDFVACGHRVARAGVCYIGTYPERPLRFIIPFPPGGGADSLARIVGAVAGESLGQQIVIDNRSGAGGNIAAEAAAKAAPDGYTLLQSNISHVISASLYRKLDYDIVRDFVPVTLLASIPFALAVHPSLDVSSIRELDRAGESETRPVRLRVVGQWRSQPSRHGNVQNDQRR